MASASLARACIKRRGEGRRVGSEGWLALHECLMGATASDDDAFPFPLARRMRRRGR